MSLEETNWLAQTKFICPALRPDVLSRPRLAQLLRQSLAAGRVTLVSAPAGYGKTTFYLPCHKFSPKNRLAG